MMENQCDIEEIIPPTPKVQQNRKFCRKTSLVNHTLKPLAKTTRVDNKNFKRKKNSGLSPEFKKCGQKVKQATLFNFFIKKQEESEALESNISSSSNVSRVNLMHKFEHCEDTKKHEPNETGNVKKERTGKNTASIPCKEKFSNEAICDSKKIRDIDSLKFSLHSVQNFLASETDDTKSNYTDNAMQLVSVTKSSPEIIICNSEINSDDNVRKLRPGIAQSCQINNTSSPSLNKYFCEPQNLEIPDDLKSEDVDHSFLLKTDLDWETCEKSFDQKCNLSSQDLILMENETICSENVEEIITKFKVEQVTRMYRENEVILTLRPTDNDSVSLKTCTLKGFWTDSLVNVGDIVNILKAFQKNKATIDNDSGFLVVNPDFLLSSTSVVSTLFCMRKAALNYVLPVWSPGNSIMMIGNLVHDIFQKAVNTHACSNEEIKTILEKVLKRRENLIHLCCQEVSEKVMEEKLSKYIPSISDWIKKYCAFERIPSSENIQITNVQGIEDNMWCPKYGVKGKIDMTVNVLSKNEANSKLMPLELKTGRHSYSAEHIGQVNLYSLMIEERTKEAADGLLLYLRDGADMKLIPTNHNSRRGLIQLRNELAFYTHKWSSANHGYTNIEDCHLPKPINDKRLCEKCPYLIPCTVYQRALGEDKHLETRHAMNFLIPSSTNHLSACHLEYFSHWSHLLLLESSSAAEAKAFWTEKSVEREKKGLCFSWVLLDENIPANQETEDAYFVHVFIRSTNSPVSSSFKNAGLKEGDYIAVSNQDNPDEVAVAMGYIVKVDDHFIKVGIERDLKGMINHKNCIFRIDKLVSNSANSCVRNNLMLLMADDNQAERLRKFVLDKEMPQFLCALSKQVVLLGRPILKPLNRIQQKVILKAMMAKDYFLIKGMPGTGKTSTIVALVRLMVQMGISVLLTSYTHSAIDNILLKLMKYIKFVRIGPQARIHPDVKKYSFESLTKDFTSAGEFSTFMKEQMVVASTCLGINHAIFQIRKFDICIVDEAAQINQIACLGPLFHAKKFILVGDDKQLPPLVLSNRARLEGMQESLFQRLENSSNCMELVLQYRMNQEIMRLCNELTYDGALQCGSEDVAKAVLHLNFKRDHQNSLPAWLLTALDTDLQKSVFFLNTDKLAASEVNNDKQGKNNIEAEIVMTIVQFLLKYDILQSDIGVIAPYRRQVDLIERKLGSLKRNEIEVNTVDQYQGRDKNIIIISCVKDNNIIQDSEKNGVILNDERRLNVAVSRARKKLIFIGRKETLIHYKPFARLMICLRADQFFDILPDVL